MLGHHHLLFKMRGVPVLGSFIGPANVLGFFVVSGYSIAASLERSQAGFAMRRVVRIAPLYFAALCFSLVPYAAFGSPIKLSGGDTAGIPAMRDALPLFLFLQGIVAVTPYFAQPLWSLACEVFYYVLAPSLLRVSMRLVGLLSVASFALFLHIVWIGENDWHLMTHGIGVAALLWTWIAGFAMYRKSHKMSVVVATLLGATIAGGTFPFAVAVVAFADRIRVPNRLKLAVTYAGELSYPLYLLHWPVLIAIGATGFAARHADWRIMAVTIPICFLVASIAYHTIDEPIRQARRRAAA
jgi:peptidoglycan/LPS O-acetylase OafA/YrhL